MKAEEIIRAWERESALPVADGPPTEADYAILRGLIDRALRQAVAGEREACAKLADDHTHEMGEPFGPYTARLIAEAIRSRGP